MEWALAVGSAEGRSPPLMAAQLINLLTERQQPGAKTQSPLFAAPGMVPLSVCGAGPIRGFRTIGINTFCVSGQGLYRLPFGGGPGVLVGTGITGTGLVSMSDNGLQICIVAGQDGGAGWIYNNLSNTLVPITSVNYFPSYNVAYLDGYFLFNRILSTQIFYSALFDGLTFNGTDFFNTETSSSPNIAIAENLELLFFFKGDRIEMYYDSGQASNPFQRYAGGVINIGCASSVSVVKQDGALFFLGSDGVIYRLQANTQIRVSTHAIETIIRGELPTLDVVSSFTFTIEGHKFVGYHLPRQGRTLVFDISSGQWHERESYTTFGASIGMWRAGTAMEAQAGQALLGDRLTGQVWTPDFQATGEGAFPIYCSVVSGVLTKDRKRITLERFQLDVETGVGNGASPNPVATLFTSKDGGRNFTSRGSKAMGAAGQDDVLLRWNKLGQARQWVLKITLNDPVKRVVIGASVDVTEGM